MQLFHVTHTVLSHQVITDLAIGRGNILNPYMFFDTKENSFGCVMNLGDDHQNFLIFIALRIARDGGWATNFWQFPTSSSLATNLSGGAHGGGGNQA